jgi:hypothetical protein
MVPWHAGGTGQVPAFVLDQVDGHIVLRYMMADGAPNKSAPTGKGDGAYKTQPDADSIVAIVGSAHVRGICRQWDHVVAKGEFDVQDLCKS